ncbi:GCN5-related N-acetyltransferase 6, chloroplastic-like isoform X1 [Salvia miltiorrhiza]|uniref:GCN5-related N-acetyltransferase 6, chloroplastic-like isoform X1 n=1 Tax=Salvia miltiorrhiza TaxID=226208 RepID=UPI0025ACADC8|nr:GCN5-related N-acetyltransferase 6, chloroplastic-like isoform X1 [Salvia miltiorrhiza]
MSTIALHRPNFSRRWRMVQASASKGAGFLKKFTPSNIIFDTPREARHHEEYWMAAWLRAESHWEGRENERYAESNRRKFAQQELNAMTRRYNSKLGEKCMCIVMGDVDGEDEAKKEDGELKHSILKSVAGTLDLSIQHLSHGQTFPGERLKHPLVCLLDRKSSICYGYIANLCIAKSARRQGVATTMLRYAISAANSNGAEKVFVHVHRHNKPARNLYQKIGFQVVDAASFQLYVEQTYLLCLDVSSCDVRLSI